MNRLTAGGASPSKDRRHDRPSQTRDIGVRNLRLGNGICHAPASKDRYTTREHVVYNALALPFALAAVVAVCALLLVAAP